MILAPNFFQIKVGWWAIWSKTVSSLASEVVVCVQLQGGDLRYENSKPNCSSCTKRKAIMKTSRRVALFETTKVKMAKIDKE